MYLTFSPSIVTFKLLDSFLLLFSLCSVSQICMEVSGGKLELNEGKEPFGEGWEGGEAVSEEGKVS